MKRLQHLHLVAALAALGGLFSDAAQAATDYPTGWTKCVKVGESCAMTGTHMLALGKSGSFVYKTEAVTGPFTCTLDMFPTNSFTTSAYCSYNPADASSSSSSSAASSAAASSSTSSASSSTSSASSSTSSASSSTSTSSVGGSAATYTGTTATAVNAKTLTGSSTPVPDQRYGFRTYSVPVLDSSGKHSPDNYYAVTLTSGGSTATNATTGASVITGSTSSSYRVTWGFATVDPTGGVMSFERATAPASGWHTWSRKGKVTVTGGSAAASNRVYTVFNGQQLVAALQEAKNESKIIRVVGHIDLRWSQNNTVFEEYTSYLDQKFGGSINIPSNTTLVGINGADGTPARITGTTLLIGQEWSTTAAILTAACGTTKASVDAETDYKAWIACGKDSEDYPTWTRNIIIRNLKIDAPWDVNPEDSGNAYVDGMTISRAQNIYLDHISMGDGDTPDSLYSDTRHDGLLDIVRGSDYVTLTNSYFFKHHKTTLIGNGDSGRAWSDQGRLHVTLSNNFWDRMESRLPLNRYGQVHMFNNYIYALTDSSVSDDLKFGSGVDPRYGSNMLLQNMYFEVTQLASTSWCGKAIGSGNSSLVGYRSSGHIMLSNKSGNTTPVAWDGQCSYAEPTGTDVWQPPYSYSVKATSEVPAAVKAGSGAGMLK